MTATPATDALEARFRRLSALSGAQGLLSWDRLVMMPPGGAEARAEQEAVLSVLGHEILTAPGVADQIAAAEAEPLDGWRAANLREMRRAYRHATAMTTELVEARSRAASRCEMQWRDARERDDFTLVRDALAELLRLIREEADAKAAVLGTGAYEALLDGYEPGGSVARIETLFAELEAALPGLLEAVLDRQARAPAPLRPAGPFPLTAQRTLARRVMSVLGFDFRHGRLDETLHPFCGGVPDDVRVTTRYSEDGFVSGIMAVIHETGHALYERGLPQPWRDLPVGQARGMAMHESQSLLMEMQVCRAPGFLGLLSRLARAAFDRDEAASALSWAPDNLTRLYTNVARGLIRVEADEVSYPLHVILRFRLERALLAGDLAVADLPCAWSDGMAGLLGVTPPGDALGCLQDIHWYDGAIGYFPTYTLGALAAAQLHRAALAADPSIPHAIAGGDFTPLLAWLGVHVHSRASSASSEEIIADATGEPLGTEAFLTHLKARYLGG